METTLEKKKENIFEKLSKVQAELNAPKSRHNKFGNYDYRSCEDILQAVKPLLASNGLILILSDEITERTGRFYVKATATVYNMETDETLQATAYARESEIKSGMDAAQITGAASSYARKYALNGLFNIDDTKDADTDEFTQPICEDCGEVIKPTDKYTVEKIVESTKKSFGVVCCMKCGALRLARIKADKEKNGG